MDTQSLQYSALLNKHERLQQFCTKLQQQNHELEGRLLQVVEKIEHDKILLSNEIDHLAERLAGATNLTSQLKHECNRYKEDCRLAVQLLHCRPSASCPSRPTSVRNSLLLEARSSSRSTPLEKSIIGSRSKKTWLLPTTEVKTLIGNYAACSNTIETIFSTAKANDSVCTAEENIPPEPDSSTIFNTCPIIAPNNLKNSCNDSVNDYVVRGWNCSKCYGVLKIHCSRGTQTDQQLIVGEFSNTSNENCLLDFYANPASNDVSKIGHFHKCSSTVAKDQVI